MYEQRVPISDSQVCAKGSPDCDNFLNAALCVTGKVHTSTFVYVHVATGEAQI